LECGDLAPLWYFHLRRKKAKAVPGHRTPKRLQKGNVVSLGVLKRKIKAEFWLVLLLLMTPSLAVASALCESTSQKLSSVVPCGFGVNIDFTEPRPGEMEMLTAAGFRWVRMDLKWDATEVEKGQYDFQSYDRLMSSLRSFGVRALLILDYGNPLYDNGAPPRSKESREAFARWAVASAKHFSGSGVLWEIYNEPNHELFWPHPYAKDYAMLAKTVGQAFREQVPGEKLIGPATSGVDFEFLETCFKEGVLEYWSAVSVHPYRREDPETAASDYRRLRALIYRYAPSREIPIIAGEWGYSATWPGLDQEKQGELLARSWLTNLASGLPLTIWYDWHDDGVNPREPEHHFGTVSHHYYTGRLKAYDPKPAYLAAKTMTQVLSGYTFVKRLQSGGPNDYVLEFQRGEERCLAAWTTRHPHRVVIDFAARDYQIVDYLGQELGRVKSRSTGIEIDLKVAPMYVCKQIRLATS